MCPILELASLMGKNLFHVHGNRDLQLTQRGELWRLYKGQIELL